MRELANGMADMGHWEATIRETLEDAFPGMPFPDCYQNIAAIAAMRTIRRGLDDEARHAAQMKRLVDAGHPAAWADKDRPAPPPRLQRPSALEEAAAANGEPPKGAIRACSCARELLALAAAHGVVFGYEPAADIVRTSRTIVKGGPLHTAVFWRRPALVEALLDSPAPPPPKGIYE